MMKAKFSTLLAGNAEPAESALEQMKARGGDWYAYQNHDMGHPNLGHLQFLQCGPDCTFKEPPARYPDTAKGGLGWRYLPVGKVNLETGKIEEVVQEEEGGKT